MIIGNKSCTYIKKWMEGANCYCRMVRLSKIIPLEYVESVEKMVQQTSEIIRESYQSWKAFCLFRLENKRKIIPFDRSTAKLVFGVICIRKGVKHKKKNETVTLEELERLKNSDRIGDLIRYFYITHYEPILSIRLRLILCQIRSMLFVYAQVLLYYLLLDDCMNIGMAACINGDHIEHFPSV